MVEIRNGKKVLITPVSAEDLKDIKVGDIIYLDGSMTTCRDVAHRRLVEEGRELPVDVRNNAIFHAGPIIRPIENDKFEMVSVGPTRRTMPVEGVCGKTTFLAAITRLTTYLFANHVTQHHQALFGPPFFRFI